MDAREVPPPPPLRISFRLSRRDRTVRVHHARDRRSTADTRDLSSTCLGSQTRRCAGLQALVVGISDSRKARRRCPASLAGLPPRSCSQMATAHQPHRHAPAAGKTHHHVANWCTFIWHASFADHQSHGVAQPPRSICAGRPAFVADAFGAGSSMPENGKWLFFIFLPVLWLGNSNIHSLRAHTSACNMLGFGTSHQLGRNDTPLIVQLSDTALRDLHTRWMSKFKLAREYQGYKHAVVSVCMVSVIDAACALRMDRSECRVMTGRRVAAC